MQKYKKYSHKQEKNIIIWYISNIHKKFLILIATVNCQLSTVNLKKLAH
jgi:hypothetical protein